MKNLTKILFLILLLNALRYPLSAAYAAVPHLINYQGRITDSSGTPLNGSYAITFRIYDAEAAGNLLWQETHTGLVIQKGIFSVLLGSVTALNLPFDKQYYLAVQVGSDPEMSPRQRITSSGYAIRAEKAENALNADLATNALTASTAISAQRADVATTLSDTSRFVPTGAIMMFKSSCPSGWKRVSELDGKFLTGGASYNSAAGGANTHSHSTPSHNHTLDSAIVSGVDPNPASGVYIGENNGYLRQKAYYFPVKDGSVLKTSTTFSGAGSTDSVDSRPPFATIILCEKE